MIVKGTKSTLFSPKVDFIVYYAQINVNPRLLFWNATILTLYFNYVRI